MLRRMVATGVDLDSVYAQTLQRIREQRGDRSRLGMEVLMWVSHSERPLQIRELCHALAVQIGSKDLDLENIPPLDTVLGSCLGLVVVDDQTSTLRLIHYTLQEYLSCSGILPHAHEILAETCLAYLNHEQVKGLQADRFPNFQSMPFLEYSSLYWGDHAKIGLSNRAKSLALDLLTGYGNHISATLLFNKMQNYNLFPVASRQFAGLHCASYFGIVEVVAALIEVEDCDINQGDCTGFTPLIWAARRGNEAVVRLLLTRDDVNPDKADKYGQTPLWWASYEGHKWVVNLLLTRNDVNPDKSNRAGQTPLSTASGNGHWAVVGLLLTREEVNPDEPDSDGRTPLWHAILNGGGSVESLLLNLDDPDDPDNDEPILLSTASGDGHKEAVRLLLSRNDVNPDKPDNHGRTLLWWASESGRTEVARGLLTRNDVNPDKPDESGQTPLSAASGNGHEAVVRLLLARDNVHPDKPDNDGRTPLWHASLNANESVVRLLLSRDDVNPDKPDNYGRTLLWWASGSGKTEAVRGLLTRHDVNPDTPDSIGRTPLLIASMHGHREIVALLQRRNNLGPLPLCPPKNLSCSVLSPPLHHATGLRPLPLHPEDDCLYSVGQPFSYTNTLTNDTPATLTPLPLELEFLPLQPEDDSFYSLLGPPLSRANASAKDTSSRGRYICDVPDCTWPSPFETKQALNRHYEVRHLSKRVDCPVPGCEMVGAKGIKREDNLRAHVRNKHGIQLDRESRVEHSVLQRPSSVIEPRGLEGGGVESGLLKMEIEGKGVGSGLQKMGIEEEGAEEEWIKKEWIEEEWSEEEGIKGERIEWCF